MKAFQDYYPENLSHCYGCGAKNEHGHRIKTFWEGEETVTHFTPEAYHTAIPGFTYGGLLASLIDCHGTGTAAAAMYRQESHGYTAGVSLRDRFIARGLPQADSDHRGSGNPWSGQGNQGTQGGDRVHCLRWGRGHGPRRSGCHPDAGEFWRLIFIQGT